MGRASTSRSNRSSRSFSSGPTSEFDPAFPPNLKRSLARNDVELAALGKLHVALRTLREAIVTEYGEETLVECVVNEEKGLAGSSCDDHGKKENENEAITTTVPEAEGDDVNSDEVIKTEEDGTDKADVVDKDKRRNQLTTAFLMRMKLRRRLLNRLARRLHRVAHIMDGGSNISAPLPPLYGDVSRRYVTKENEESGLALKVLGSLDDVAVIRERDVVEFVKRENKKKEVKGDLERLRKERLGGEVKKEKGESTKVEEVKMVSDSMDIEHSETAHEGDGKKSSASMDDKAEVNTHSMDIDADSLPEKGSEKDFSDGTLKEDIVPTSDVDLLLQGDEEDKPLYDQLAEYEPGYDKLYSVGPPPPLPTISMPPSKVASSNDSEEKNAEDSPDDKAPTLPADHAPTAVSTDDIHEAPSPSKDSAVSTKENQVLKVTVPIVTTKR